MKYYFVIKCDRLSMNVTSEDYSDAEQCCRDADLFADYLPSACTYITVYEYDSFSDAREIYLTM